MWAVLEFVPLEKTPSAFDYRMGNRTAIYVPFPQAVPARPVIDPVLASIFSKANAAVREKCQAGAIRFDDVGAVDHRRSLRHRRCYRLPALQHRKSKRIAESRATANTATAECPDVIDSLQFERLVSASGPTGGEIRRPSDGKIPKTVVFVSCVGSRDNAKGISYCSKICCMYTAKHTMLYKHKVHDGEAHVFYMDIRAGGKIYDEFIRRALNRTRQYHRGRVSKITAGKRAADRPRRRYAGRRAAYDRSRSGRVGGGHAAGRSRRGTGTEAQRGLRRKRFSFGIASEAAARRDQRGRRVRVRRMPRAEGHSRVGRSSQMPWPAKC